MSVSFYKTNLRKRIAGLIVAALFFALQVPFAVYGTAVAQELPPDETAVQLNESEVTETSTEVTETTEILETTSLEDEVVTTEEFNSQRVVSEQLVEENIVEEIIITESKEIEAKALDDHQCDDTEWHFVITQIDEEANAPASIFVTWDNEETETVPLDKFTGGVAHYSTESNLDSSVESATAEIYASWDGQFNLSHGPCDNEGSIKIIKDAQPNHSQNFDFTTTGEGLGEFTLDDDDDSEHFNFELFTGLSEGTYTVTEEEVEGWKLTDIVCTGNADTSWEENVLTIELEEGDGAVCEFVNVKVDSSIKIIKDAQPDSHQNFSFTATGTGTENFTLDDDNDDTLSDWVMFTELNEGIYTFTEGEVSGWMLDEITCSRGADFEVVGSTLTIELSEDEDVVCTFVNVQDEDEDDGRITIVKDAHPNDAQDFSFTTTGSGLSSFMLDDDSDGTLSNTRTFSGLMAGHYTVTEADTAGWDLDSVVCNEAADVSVSGHTLHIDLATDQHVTCTFHNDKVVVTTGGGGGGQVLGITTPVRQGSLTNTGSDSTPMISLIAGTLILVSILTLSLTGKRNEQENELVAFMRLKVINLRYQLEVMTSRAKYDARKLGHTIWQKAILYRLVLKEVTTFKLMQLRMTILAAQLNWKLRHYLVMQYRV